EEHEAHCESFQIPLLSDAVPLWLGADTSRGGIVCNKVGILSILRCENLVMFQRRSYWIPGVLGPTLPEKCNAFLRPLKNKDFKEESMTRMRLDNLSTSTPLESNKSHARLVDV